MRKELREAGVTYKVYKNTMMNFAFKGTPCEELCQHLEGTNALAVCMEDATAPARILAKYAKDVRLWNQQQVLLKTLTTTRRNRGTFQSSFKRRTAWKLLGSIQSPITNFARVLNQIAEQQGGAAAE